MTDPTLLRSRIQDLYRRLGELLDTVPRREPTVAGVVYRLRTRCGKRPCLCQEGKLHSAWCLSYVEGRRRRLRTLAPEAKEALEPMAQRYRQTRRLRARMNRTFRELLEAFDRLERSLRVPAGRALERFEGGGR